MYYSRSAHQSEGAVFCNDGSGNFLIQILIMLLPHFKIFLQPPGLSTIPLAKASRPRVQPLWTSPSSFPSTYSYEPICSSLNSYNSLNMTHFLKTLSAASDAFFYLSTRILQPLSFSAQITSFFKCFLTPKNSLSALLSNSHNYLHILILAFTTLILPIFEITFLRQRLLLFIP